LPDGAVLNEQMLLAGLAVADDRWPHRHDDRYRLLQLQAQRERVGRWSGDAPAGR
jgi:endonuclease YncB( thermonuclease family)